MNLETAIELFREAILHALMLVSPILITTIAVGLTVSLVQTITSIQEQTLTFAPKLFAVGGVLVASSAWLMKTLMTFATNAFQKIAEIPL